MKHLRFRIAVTAGAAVALLALSAGAVRGQTPPNAPARIVASVPALPASGAVSDFDTQIIEMSYRYRRPIVRIGQDYVVRAGEEVRHVVVIWGSTTIEGRVADDVVVILGEARLSATAEVDGSVVVVAGGATISPGARIRQDLVVVGGAVDAPAGFWPGGEHVIVGAPVLGDRVRQIVPWITRGLLLGRPIVPDLPWVWAVFGVVFLISLALNQLFDRPVRASAQAVLERPLRTFLTGMLVLLVSGPILLILAASVLGLIVVPFLVCAALVAWAIGKVGVVRAIGGGILRPADPESRFQAFRSFVIGFAVLGLAYMIPVVGGITWALVSMFGLGAGTLAFVAAIRREYPAKPRPPVVVLPPPMPPSPRPPAPSAPFEPAGHAPVSSMSEAAPAVEPPPFPSHASTAPAAAPVDGLLAFPRGAFLDRAAAFALDCVLVAIAVQLFDLRQDEMFFVVLLGYHIAFWAWKGTTLGGIIIGLRVVRTDGGELRAIDAVVRGLSSLFSFAALGLGCFWMLQDAERQTWHDKIAGTYVVKVPRHLAMT
jgi:uncharacterized RDD family membrane protein YckC